MGKEIQELYDHNKKPIKIVGVMCSKRSKNECAREDPSNLEVLKVALNEARKLGAETEILDLRELKIGACKECYSTCPAQCRFNEKTTQCDCYMFKQDTIFLDNGEFMPIEEAYDKLDKKEFFRLYHSKGNLAEQDDMWKVYKSFLEADGIIFSTSTIFYSRPALLQIMLSRLCALDGGVEEIWGDGKNLGNSINYAKRKGIGYKERLYGRQVAFINISKEGDSVTPDLMKACSMMGMNIIPFSVSYKTLWYDDKTNRKDKSSVINDEYTISLAKDIGKEMVKRIKSSDRKYGTIGKVV